MDWIVHWITWTTMVVWPKTATKKRDDLGQVAQALSHQVWKHSKDKVGKTSPSNLFQHLVSLAVSFKCVCLSLTQVSCLPTCVHCLLSHHCALPGGIWLHLLCTFPFGSWRNSKISLGLTSRSMSVPSAAPHISAAEVDCCILADLRFLRLSCLPLKISDYKESSPITTTFQRW